MTNAPSDNEECELCDNPATHFCECDGCRNLDGETDPDDEQRDGRWLLRWAVTPRGNVGGFEKGE